MTRDFGAEVAGRRAGLDLRVRHRPPRSSTAAPRSRPATAAASSSRSTASPAGAADGRASDWFFYVERDRVAGRRRRVRARRRRPGLVGLPRLDRGDAGAGGGRLLARAVRARVRRASGIATAVVCLARAASSACRCRPPRGVRSVERLVMRRRRDGATPAERDDPRPRRALGRGSGPTPTPACSPRAPSDSGVFARFSGARPRRCSTLLNQRAEVAGSLGRGGGAGGRAAARRRPADLGRDRHRRRPGWRPRPRCSATRCANRYAVATDGGRRADRGAGAMRPALAYAPGRSPLHRAIARRRDRLPRRARGGRLRLLEPADPARGRRRRGRAPGSPPAPGGRCAPRCASALPLLVLMIGVNALVSHRGDTVLLRGWELPVLGNTDVTLESLAAGGDDRPAGAWWSCSPSPSTRPASTPTGCCGAAARSRAARR